MHRSVRFPRSRNGNAAASNLDAAFCGFPLPEAAMQSDQISMQRSCEISFPSKRE